ncbi:MAG: type II toxin-antitoxin system RelE/ParE family toxin [Sandaracinaceae bacterium]|nr:type II toxin-antitoxin system RelE/ParE family toxin [Sandaracinaceae bacterium]
MRVSFAPQALEDLVATIEYIARDNPVAAASLGDRVFEMVDRLAEGGLDASMGRSMFSARESGYGVGRSHH